MREIFPEIFAFQISKEFSESLWNALKLLFFQKHLWQIKRVYHHKAVCFLK